MNSETFHYKKGANQQFCQSSHIFDPTLYNEEDLMYNPDREVGVLFDFVIRFHKHSFFSLYLHSNRKN